MMICICINMVTKLLYYERLLVERLFLMFVSPGDLLAVKSFIEGGSETFVCSVSFSVDTS